MFLKSLKFFLMIWIWTNIKELVGSNDCFIIDYASALGLTLF
jgi:hypothetical protein